MSVQQDGLGRRFVQAETEVRATPAEAWRAVATGAGISSWFFPTELEERVGGEAACRLGPGMESTATVTAWDPPRRFEAESDDLGPEAPPLVTEWSVRPSAPDACIVRVVHSVKTPSSAWDAELESFEFGWGSFFPALRHQLAVGGG